MLVQIASIKDIKSILKILGGNRESSNFYSDFEENVLKYILTKKCFIVSSKNGICGLILVNSNRKIVSFIPSEKNEISFFRLIYILKKQMNVNGYKFTVQYKNINIVNLQKYFPFYILSNVRHMFIDLDDYNEEVLFYNGLNIRNLVTSKEASIRVNLQNEVFGHIEGRTELTLKEVLDETEERGFIDELCFLLEFRGEPAGYGQIIFINGNYYLVNFGIIPLHRKKGFGNIFVNQILSLCKKRGIKKLYLKVDFSNPDAISLYRKVGFKDISNILSIII